MGFCSAITTSLGNRNFPLRTPSEVGGLNAYIKPGITDDDF